MSSARDTHDNAAQHAVETNQMLATMVAMTLALTFWGVTVLKIGEPRMWFFAALATVLTFTAFALMRPSASGRGQSLDEEWSDGSERTDRSQ